MKTVCVFCGANPGRNPAFKEQALVLADELAAQGYHLVYGGSDRGLMAVIANRVLEQGGQVIGVIPETLVEREVAHTGLTELQIVTNMSERKDIMMARSDAFIAMPGGFGTLDELFEALTACQLGTQQKPVGLLNVAGYYDHLLKFLDTACENGLLTPNNHALLQSAIEPAELLERLKGSFSAKEEQSLSLAVS